MAINRFHWRTLQQNDGEYASLIYSFLFGSFSLEESENVIGKHK